MQTKTIEVPHDLVKYKDRYMTPVDEDGFEGYRNWYLDAVLGAAEIKDLHLKWKGSKIPIAIWHQLCAYFEAQYALTKGEAQARFFYNPKAPEWKVWVFPQEWSSGMTTKEIEDHPDRGAQSLGLGADFICWGTIHHHCSGSAFQSGVDEHDEVTQNGIHITIGHIGSKQYDLNGRVYFSGVKYTCSWEHWFEYDPCPPWVTGILNQMPVKDRALAHAWFAERFSNVEKVLKEPPPSGTLFPQQWLDNLVKPKWQSNGGGHHGHSFPQQGQGPGQGRIQIHSGYKTDPKPYQFATDIDRLVSGSQLHETVIQVLLDEVCEHGIIAGNGKTMGEAEFLGLFGKICIDCDIMPRAAAGRMARQKLYPSAPKTEDEMRTLEAICVHGGDADLMYAEMIPLMGNLYTNPHCFGVTDKERELVQYLRQLASHAKVSMSELSRLFFDYVDPKYFAEVNLPHAEEQALQRELREQQQGVQGGHPWPYGDQAWD